VLTHMHARIERVLVGGCEPCPVVPVKYQVNMYEKLAMLQ
jgi:hypothetical protein